VKVQSVFLQMIKFIISKRSKVNMEALLDVISVKTRDHYTLELVFENGERRIFDMTPFFDKKPFVKLLNSPQTNRTDTNIHWSIL
jgi:hypothetical protein